MVFPYKNIGEYLEYEFLEKYQINQRLLASLIKVHNNRINEIIRGKRSVTIDTDLRLCKFFNLEDGHFFDLQTKMEYEKTKNKIQKVLNEMNTYNTFWGKKKG